MCLVRCCCGVVVGGVRLNCVVVLVCVALVCCVWLVWCVDVFRLCLCLVVCG